MKVLLGIIPMLLMLSLSQADAVSFEGTSIQNPTNFLDFTIGEQINTPSFFSNYAKFSIDHGTITLNGVLVPLFDSTIQIYGDGKHFVLRDPAGISMFGTYIPSTTAKDFRVKINTWEGQQFNTETFIISETIPVKITNPQPEATPEEPKTELKKTGPKIKLIVKSATVGYLENNYLYAAKVFDAKQNPSGIFDQSLGLIKEAQITGRILNPSGVLQQTIEGEVNEQGVFTESWFIPFQSTLTGPYILELTAVAEFSDSSISHVSSTKNFFVDQMIDSGS